MFYSAAFCGIILRDSKIDKRNDVKIWKNYPKYVKKSVNLTKKDGDYLSACGKYKLTFYWTVSEIFREHRYHERS